MLAVRGFYFVFRFFVNVIKINVVFLIDFKVIDLVHIFLTSVLDEVGTEHIAETATVAAVQDLHLGSILIVQEREVRDVFVGQVLRLGEQFLFFGRILARILFLGQISMNQPLNMPFEHHAVREQGQQG